MLFRSLFLVVLLGHLAYRYIQNARLLRKVTGRGRGTNSERALLLNLLRAGIDERAIFHDLYLEWDNGRYAQIDVVVATKVGIIVFEDKDYSGWIFGSGNQKEWTQVMNYGQNRYRFYNPIWQNQGHIRALRHRLAPYGNVPYFSVVVFNGDCELRDVSDVPDDVYLIHPTDVKAIIKDILEGHAPASYKDKHAIMTLLNEAVTNGANSEIKAKHKAVVDRMSYKRRWWWF